MSERFAIKCRNTKTKVTTTACQEKGKRPRISWEKRSKTLATKSWLVFVLHLIGRESDVSFQDHARDEVKPMQSWITYGTRWKLLNSWVLWNIWKSPWKRTFYANSQSWFVQLVTAFTTFSLPFFAALPWFTFIYSSKTRVNNYCEFSVYSTCGDASVMLAKGGKSVVTIGLNTRTWPDLREVKRLDPN